MSHKRKCVLDGTIYEYCPNCSGYNSNEKWRLIYCSDNCRQIDHIRDDYKSGRIDLNTAKSEMRKYNVPNLNKIMDWAKETIKEILSEDNSLIEEKVSKIDNEIISDVNKRKRKNKKSNNNETIVNEDLENIETPTIKKNIDVEINDILEGI